MQLMPATASSLQVDDSFHPEKNIDGGVRYLRYLIRLFNGDLRLALAAYNAGEKAVMRYGGIPPYRETQDYVQRVLSYLNGYKKPR
jgi:soluble lytic murein transglycosylase-like protein